VVQTVTQPNDTVAVSMFNQSNTTAQSPVLIYQGQVNKMSASNSANRGLPKNLIKPMQTQILKKLSLPRLQVHLRKSQALSGFY
jgi:hypothetical protein